MRSIQPQSRRRWSASSWLLLLCAPLVLVGGVIGLLLLMGVDLNLFATPSEDPNVVRIPINTRNIPAFEKIVRDDLLNPGGGGLMYQRVPPAATVGMTLVHFDQTGQRVTTKVKETRFENQEVLFVTAEGATIPHGAVLELGGAIMNVNGIIGRVLKIDKSKGLAFSESNFFPVGTAEGLSGATPPGMRAVTLDATKLKGIHALNSGDHVDLMASVPANLVSTFDSGGTARLPGAALIRPAGTEREKDETTQPILLAQDAIIIKPVYVRNEATTSSSLTQGKRVQNTPIYEAALAVKPEDVLPLQNALDQELKITCVALSRQVEAEKPAAVESKPQGPTAPIAHRAILAYEVLAPGHFQNPATRGIRYESVSEERIAREEIITSLEEILGAVAKHDIPAGSYVTRRDLLGVKSPGPKGEDGRRTGLPAKFRFASQVANQEDVSVAGGGQRPPITNFIPSGYAAIALPWNRLYGAEHLQIADHIDLMASYSLERATRETETETRPDGTKVVRERDTVDTRLTQRSWDESLGNRGESWFIASDAIVVGPLGYPPPAAAVRYLGEDLYRTGGGANDALSGPPVLIAVEERDLEVVAAALATADVHFTATFHRNEEESDLPRGMKRVVIAAQDLRAYEELTEQTWQANRRHPVTRLVDATDPRFADAVGLHELGDFFGRVLARDVRRYSVITPADFLPAGTRPGLAAGLGEGETAIVLSDRDVTGLDRFENGDSIALIRRSVTTAPTGAIVHAGAASQASAVCVVQHARILQATRDGQTTVAVALDDAARLQAGLVKLEQMRDDRDIAAPLTAIARPRSSDALNGDTQANHQPPRQGGAIQNHTPLEQAHRLDLFVGRRHEVHLYMQEDE